MPELELWNAAQAARLDLERLWRGQYDARFLAKIVAWHNLTTLIDLHRQDAALAQQEADARKQRNRRR